MRSIVVILAIALWCPANFAAEKPAKTPSVPQQSKTKFRPFYGKVKTYDKAAASVILQGPKAQTFAIITETKINKDGKPATVDALVAGETIGGRAREGADGRWEALTLNVGKKPAAAASQPRTSESPKPATPAKDAQGSRK